MDVWAWCQALSPASDAGVPFRGLAANASWISAERTPSSVTPPMYGLRPGIGVPVLLCLMVACEPRPPDDCGVTNPFTQFIVDTTKELSVCSASGSAVPSPCICGICEGNDSDVCEISGTGADISCGGRGGGIDSYDESDATDLSGDDGACCDDEVAGCGDAGAIVTAGIDGLNGEG